jgi:hypothetical protein
MGYMRLQCGSLREYVSEQVGKLAARSGKELFIVVQATGPFSRAQGILVLLREASPSGRACMARTVTMCMLCSRQAWHWGRRLCRMTKCSSSVTWT